MTEYDIELLNELNKEIEKGVVKILENTDSFFDDIERWYPIGFSGVDWSKKEYIFFFDLNEDSKVLVSQKVGEYLQQIIEKFPELLDENLIVLGDGLTNLGFEMKLIDFMKINKLFFVIPQHTYIWFTETKKLINLTFEGELYFG